MSDDKEVDGFLRVPTIAKILGCDQAKVLGWIRSGELRAIDISDKRNLRPRWRVRIRDWETFLASRSTTPLPKPVRQTRKSPTITQYF